VRVGGEAAWCGHDAKVFGADAIFEARRPAMTGLAYRMLGSRAEAEDVVQDARLRWRKVDADTVESPDAYLNRVVTRLALTG
jgi:RNA polymerase sigma-70 factor (ECF subfamily)